MTIVYEMSSRAPKFIESSHLEAAEGMVFLFLTFISSMSPFSPLHSLLLLLFSLFFFSPLITPSSSITNTPSTAWTAYWSPILKTLTHQCLNPCRSIRQQAFSSLQRTLLSNEALVSSSSRHTEWTAIFTEVLFPLIGELLKPEVFQSDPVGMSETRVRAATLLSRVFLHYLGALADVDVRVEEKEEEEEREEGKDGKAEEGDLLLGLWLRVVGIMDRLMNSGQGDNLVCLPRFPFLVAPSLPSFSASFFFSFRFFLSFFKGCGADTWHRKKPSRRTSRICCSSCPTAGTLRRRRKTRRARNCGARRGKG